MGLALKQERKLQVSVAIDPCLRGFEPKSRPSGKGMACFNIKPESSLPKDFPEELNFLGSGDGAEIAFDAACISNAELDVVLVAEPGTWVKSIAF